MGPAPTLQDAPGGPRAVELGDVARSARLRKSTPLASDASRNPYGLAASSASVGNGVCPSGKPAADTTSFHLGSSTAIPWSSRSSRACSSALLSTMSSNRRRSSRWTRAGEMRWTRPPARSASSAMAVSCTRSTTYMTHRQLRSSPIMQS